MTLIVSADEAVKPPVAKIVPKPSTTLGETRIDNYFWLRDRNDPDTIKYLEAENEYTKAEMKHTDALQSKLYSEILGRIQQTDLSVPTKRDDYFYYTRTEEGKQYAIYCRKHGSLDAKEEVLLDGNAMAEGKKYFRVGNFAASPNHKLLAYSVDYRRRRSVHHSRQGSDHRASCSPMTIPNTYYSLEWANDNATFFYTVLDAAKRPYKVYRHTLGVKKDALVCHETDERFTVELEKTRSRAYILINIGSSLTSEVRYVKADQPKGKFATLLPRVQETEYDVTHHGDSWFIRTNDGAKTFRVDRSAGEGSVARELERSDARASRGDHRKRHRVQGLSGDRGARSRPDQDPHSEFRDRRYALHRVPRAGLYREPRRQRRVRYQAAALQLHFAGDAQLGVRLQHGHARHGS